MTVLCRVQLYGEGAVGLEEESEARWVLKKKAKHGLKPDLSQERATGSWVLPPPPSFLGSGVY
eukprot:3620975-Rhodomonas_salina.1